MRRAYLSSGLEDRITKVGKLAAVAEEVGATMAQFSIAWVASDKHVSTVLLRATGTKQLDENLKALEFIDKITPDIRAKVDEIVQFHPEVVPSAEPFVHHVRSKFLSECGIEMHCEAATPSRIAHSNAEVRLYDA